MPDTILNQDPATLGRAAIRKRLRAIADHQRALRRGEQTGETRR